MTGGSALGMVFAALGWIFGITSIVCWIMVLVKIFKTNVLYGILGILCAIFAFIYGWVKVNEWGIKNVMIVWTIAVVGGLIANFLSVGAIMSSNG